MIRGSMSVPVLFKSVFIDNNVHLDGGLFNNVQVDVMMKKNVKYIIASCLDKGENALEGGVHYPSLFNTFIKSTNANSDSHSNRFQSFVDLVFQPEVGHFGLLNWKAHDQIYRVGYKHAISILEANLDLVKLLKS